VRTNKRFYDTVAIHREDDGFRVLLGGRPVRTPEGIVLTLPMAALAAAVANEWLAQKETIRPETMPLTRLAVTAVTRIPPHRSSVVDAVAAYAASDLLCYRADAPSDLVDLQHATWQPLIEWAAVRWDAPLRVGTGILPIAQPQAAIEGLRQPVDHASDLELTVLASVVQASGSLIVGLALLHQRIDAEAAVTTALLDELYQAARWGADAEAERRRREIADDIRAAAAFLALTRGGSDSATRGGRKTAVA
jgi:chaperone required for assembly of F1-ATPase